jgi:hypothetical protein
MKFPRTKQSLAVFLRDYGGRKKKSRTEKIQIIEHILNTRKVELNGETTTITDRQWNTLNGLYHKYILGKWNAQFSNDDILTLYTDDNQGYTIHEIAGQLECSDEIVRRRVNKLVEKKILVRDVNAKNRRQGVFKKRDSCMVDGIEVGVPA